MNIAFINKETKNQFAWGYFSRKKDGSMRLHGNAEYDAPASRRRAAYFASKGIDGGRAIAARLVHGNKIEIVSKPSNSKLVWNDFSLPDTDGLITGDKGVWLAITAADCPAVFLADPVKEIIALVHSGWKGTLKEVVPAAVRKMQSEFNCSPSDIQAYISPSIQSCHFEVKKDVWEKFPENSRAVVKVQVPPAEGGAAWEERDGYFVDLPFVIAQQLKALGLADIKIDSDCTFCHKGISELKTPPDKSIVEYQYFSFRREKTDPLQTQMAVFGMI